MKAILTFSTTLFFSISIILTGYAQTQKEYWEDGSTLKAEGAYSSSNTKTGTWKYFYKNGQLEASGDYTGKTTDKPINVVRLGRNTAVDDKKTIKTGEWLFYYDNGQKKAKGIYRDGCPEGIVVRWYKSGEKMEEVEYVACKAVGNRKVWDKAGWLKFETRVEGNGRSVELEWYQNGQKKAEIPYKNGQQYGRVKRWYVTGQKEEDVMMKNTRVHGSYRSWYPNGNKQREFFSINNVMSGEYREWSDNGTLLWEIIERSDDGMIIVKNYWDNGEIKMKGISKLPSSLSIHQWAQTRQGQWTYWYKDKSVLKTENYDDGKLVSTEMP